MEKSTVVSASPRLTAFSAPNDILADTVDRKLTCLDHPLPFIGDGGPQSQHQEEEEEVGDDGLYEDDEFTFLCGNPASPVPADEIFHNGQIKPMYQVFVGDTFFVDEPPRIDSDGDEKKSHRTGLKALLSADKEAEEADSSLEADDLAPETYCMWNPRVSASPLESCEKSNSAGSSSSWRWKLKELLLKRSNSVGTTAVVVVGTRERGGVDQGIIGDGKAKPEGRQVVEYYVRQRNDRSMIQRRKSFLPYRQNLVGFFTNVNGLTRNLHHF